VPKELVLCHVTYNAPVTDHLRHCLDHLFFSFSRVAVWGLSFISSVIGVTKYPARIGPGPPPLPRPVYEAALTCVCLSRILLQLLSHENRERQKRGLVIRVCYLVVDHAHPTLEFLIATVVGWKNKWRCLSARRTSNPTLTSVGSSYNHQLDYQC
jgi:hypothetical protein